VREDCPAVSLEHDAVLIHALSIRGRGRFERHEAHGHAARPRLEVRPCGVLLTMAGPSTTRSPHVHRAGDAHFGSANAMIRSSVSGAPKKPPPVDVMTTY
jgi:hypothetical protein